MEQQAYSSPKIGCKLVTIRDNIKINKIFFTLLSRCFFAFFRFICYCGRLFRIHESRRAMVATTTECRRQLGGS